MMSMQKLKNHREFIILVSKCRSCLDNYEFSSALAVVGVDASEKASNRMLMSRLKTHA